MKKPKFSNKLDQLGRDLFLGAAQKPRVVTCAQGVVSYSIPQKNPDTGTILQHVLDPMSIDDKIREILAITPDITLESLKKFGAAMGIAILHFEKAKPPAAPPPDEDVIF